MHHLDAYKKIKGEWALLQILSNLGHSFTGLYSPVRLELAMLVSSLLYGTRVPNACFEFTVPASDQEITNHNAGMYLKSTLPHNIIYSTVKGKVKKVFFM